MGVLKKALEEKDINVFNTLIIQNRRDVKREQQLHTVMEGLNEDIPEEEMSTISVSDSSSSQSTVKRSPITPAAEMILTLVEDEINKARNEAKGNLLGDQVKPNSLSVTSLEEDIQDDKPKLDLPESKMLMLNTFI